MNFNTVLLKLSGVAMVSFSLAACSFLPPTDGILSDEKEAYKKAHELPLLEIPPDMLNALPKNEYDGAAKAARSPALVKVTALEDIESAISLQVDEDVSYLLVRDSIRSTWRRTMSALNELNYDIEDKNRETGLIYLNIPMEGKEGMLSSLSFWKKVKTTPYLLTIGPLNKETAIHVLNEQKERVNDAVSSKILTDLMAELKQ